MASKPWHYSGQTALALVKTGGLLWYSKHAQTGSQTHIFCVSSPATMFHPLIFLSIPIFNYNMSLSFINVLLLTVAFAHAIPQRGPNLGEAELDKLYPKCWVDVSTMQGTVLRNVPGRCQVKVGRWKNVFAHTLGIAGGCGKQPLFGVFFRLNCDVFQ